jgi:hypothetical protein
MPREEKFFEQFNDHARTLVDGAVALRDLLEGGSGVPEACARIVQHEDKADAIARAVLVGVRRSFITPFDRGDMKELINQLDDAIDQMKKTAKATLFEVSSFELRCARWPTSSRCRIDGGSGGLLALRDSNRINTIAEEIPAGRTSRRAQRPASRRFI